MSIECPNHRSISNRLSACSVLEELGINYIVSPNRSGGPCKKCKTEWVDGQVPTKDSLTTPMKAIVKANGKIELPTITEQVSSFVESVAKWVGNGFENVPADEKVRRLKICRSNECGLHEESSDRCLECGCICELKAGFSHERCGIGKWGPENLGQEILNNAPKGCQSCGHK